jgi:transcriptional regulator with XRE-family HTH domain
MHNIGQIIKEKREELGLTQEQLAHMVGYMNYLCWNSGGSLSMRIAAGNLRFLKGEDSRIVMRVAGYFTQGAMLSV